MVASISHHSFSQNYEMDYHDGRIVKTCTGIFIDSRLVESDYYNNENYSVTFCSGTPGDILRLIVNPDESTSVVSYNNKILGYTYYLIVNGSSGSQCE
tara:strand:- start:152 stop:445 length:294 start_codon:yes stop_codon:yes gene_type:complete